MRTRLAVSLALVVAVLSSVSGQKPTPDMMFEAARHLEVVDGDLTGAIRQYEAIIAAHGGDRAVHARALVHLAECKRKAGNAEFRRILERVVRDFADQTEFSERATAALNALQERDIASGAFAARVAWTAPPDADIHGKISPDGRYVPFRDGRYDGDLFVQDLALGTARRLTQGAPRKTVEEAEYAEGSAFSRDGRFLAYGWRVRARDTYQIRVVPLEGSGVPQYRVLLDNDEVVWAAPFDWTADGKSIAVLVRRRDGTAQIAMLPVADGRLRPLKSMAWRGVSNVALSPDGSHLAFDVRAEDSPARDIFMLSTDAQRETTLLRGPSDEGLVGWSADGRHLLFTSDRTGAVGLWALPVGDGKVTGPAALLKKDIGQFWPMGVSRSGRLYGATVSPESATIGMAHTDPRTGEVLRAQTLDEFVGPTTFLRWAHQGTHLAYVSQWMGHRPVTPRFSELMRLRLLVRDISAGRVVELPTQFEYLNDLAWSADGGALLGGGADLQDRRGVFRIDVATGATDAIVRVDPDEQATMVGAYPDVGGKLYYQRIRISNQTIKLMERDLVSGTERAVHPYRSRNEVVYVGVVDGRLLTLETDASAGSQALFISEVDGTSRQEVLRFAEAASAAVPWYRLGHQQSWLWLPDRKSLMVLKPAACAQAGAACQRGAEVWRVRVDREGVTRVATLPDGWSDVQPAGVVGVEGAVLLKGVDSATGRARFWRLGFDGSVTPFEGVIDAGTAYGMAASADGRYMAYTRADSGARRPLEVVVMEHYMPGGARTTSEARTN